MLPISNNQFSLRHTRFIRLKTTALAALCLLANVGVAAPNPPMAQDPLIGITPVTRSMEQTGGTAAINTSGSGTWRASVSDNWILLMSSSGTAGYPVGYSVSANNGVEARIGYVYVSGYVHAITQSGLGATLGSYSANFERGGGTGSVKVNAPSGMAWHAKSNASWITLSSSSGTGTQSLSFTVSQYDEVSTRSGTITVADNTFTVYQTGRRMQLKTSSATTDYFGETIKIRVNALADTEWGVSANADWMTIVDAGSGRGGDEVKVSVAENPSYNSRSGTVTIGTETFSVTQLGRTSLVFKINPTEFAEFGVDGTSGERIAVTATPDLRWTATASADWIELYSGGASGSGNGGVTFKVKPNPTLYPRSGSITVSAADGGVAAKRLEISQAAAVASLTVDSYEFEAAGETLTVGVNTGAIVGWNVINNTSWISVSSPSTTGPADITLTAAANTSVQPRSGTIVIADHEFRVSQKGRGVAIDYDETKIFDTDGKTTGNSVDNVIAVLAEADVEWKAVASDPTWIVIYEGLSGKGNGTVKFAVAPYVGSGEIRTGMITIGDQVAYVTQRPYELSIEPNGQWVNGNAGAGEIQVALDIDGVWNAIATEPWITVISGHDSGTGSGKVLFSYTDNNTGKQRTGKIVINGAIYTLTQAARQNVSVSASVEGHGGHVGGVGVYGRGEAVEIVAIPDDGYEFCAWTLTDGTIASTNATIQMTVTASVEYQAIFAPLAPDITSAESSSSGTRLGWRNIAWAARYHVWRGTTPDPEQAEIIATLANDAVCEYFDASGEENCDYWYWIEAEGTDDNVLGSAARGWRGKERFAIHYENLRGTTHSNPPSYTEGEKFQFSPPSGRVGYTFSGWAPAGIDTTATGDVSVRAIWLQNEFAVRFAPNGGTGSIADEPFVYGFWKYLASNSFTRVGYTFTGWSDDAASAPSFLDSESVKNLTSEPNGLVMLYSQWLANTYELTLDIQNGSDTTNVTATYGSANPAITVPTRTGYTFGGYWTAADGGGTQYYTASGTSARNWDRDADTTLYAKWTANTYAVTLDRQSGSGGTASVTATYESAMPSITVPTRTGYTFGGYYTSANGGGTQYYTAAGASARTWNKTAATTLYAKWTANTYTVTLNRQSGSGGTASVTATYGSAMPSITVPTRTGYTFGGYYTSANGGGTQYYTAAGASARTWNKTAATTLYAKWTANTYVVTFDPQSGTGGSESATATYGSAMPSIAVPTRTGYTFGGYYTSANGGGPQYYTASGASARNWDRDAATTLYAKWTANTYTVTLDQQSGSGGTASVTVAYDSAMPSISVPTRTGYTFGGYWTATNGGGTQYYDASGASVRNWDKTFAMTLYAKWTANTYEIAFHANGGEGEMPNQTNTYDIATSLYSNEFARVSHRYLGWATNETGAVVFGDGEIVSNLTAVANGVVDLFAVWQPITMEVSFDLNHEDAPAAPIPPIIVTNGMAYGTLPVPERTGYSFDRWTSGRETDSPTITAGTIVTEVTNHALYAQWSANTYSVTLNRQDGTGGTASTTATYGLAMPSITVPTRTGYTFGGYWTAANGGGTQYYTASGASARNWDKAVNTTLYAKWTANTYSVMLDRQSGSGGTTSVTATYGSALPSITVPTRTGYTFGGYWTAANGGGTQYYNAAGASARNWDKTANTTLYAKWTINTYTITLDRQSGSGGTASVTATYGSAMPSVTVPTRTGYTFGGYWTAANGGGMQYYTASGASARNWDKAANTTLYAMWIANTYTLALDKSGGNGGTDTVAAIFGQTLPDITIPSKNGFCFGGYYSSPNGEGLQYYNASGQGTRNWDTTQTTLYAKWTLWSYSVSSGKATIIGCAAPNGDITIPSSLDGYPVTAIGREAFWDCVGLTSVTIPDSVTHIWNYAFYGCVNLKTISIPKGVSFIGESAFEDCANLVAVTIPNGVRCIEGHTFFGCESLSTMTIPSTITEIKYWAFMYCYNLSTINIPNSVTSIGWDAFRDCRALKYLVIPSSVTSIQDHRYGSGVFSGCDSLEALVLPTRFEGKTSSMAIPDNCQVVFADAPESMQIVSLDKGDGIDGTTYRAVASGSNMPTISLPTRAGYTFGGYYSAPNGGGTQYYTATGASVRNWDKSEATTLYAKWTQNETPTPAPEPKSSTVTTYKVAFNANGGEGLMVTQSMTYGKEAKLNKNKFTRKGYVFIGWAISKNGAVVYANCATVGNLSVNGGTATLYAKWAKKTYKVAFYTNGGKGKMPAQTMTYGKAARLRKNKFTRNGYAFRGWATSKANAKKGKVAYKNKAKVKNLVTNGKTVKLYAVWKKK